MLGTDYKEPPRGDLTQKNRKMLRPSSRSVQEQHRRMHAFTKLLVEEPSSTNLDEVLAIDPHGA